MIHIIGGGLAGSEAAWQAASLGVPVVIHEMRPVRATAVHKTDRLAELVCSNSFRGDKLDNAVGLLKEEMRRKQQKLEEYHEREKTLQETMVTAQRISEDIKASAKKEGELVINEAELQAEKIVADAHRKLVQVIDDINELKRQRVLARFEPEIEAMYSGGKA